MNKNHFEESDDLIIDHSVDDKEKKSNNPNLEIEEETKLKTPDTETNYESI